MDDVRELTDCELETMCESCDVISCGKCNILKEREWRIRSREVELHDREHELRIREVNQGQDRDVFHDGSIIKGGGVSKPEWMGDDEYQEYRMGSEYAHEVSCVNDSVFDEPEYDDDDYREVDE